MADGFMERELAAQFANKIGALEVDNQMLRYALKKAHAALEAFRAKPEQATQGAQPTPATPTVVPMDRPQRRRAAREAKAPVASNG